MAASDHTTAGTQVPHKKEGGFPPFDTTTFPSQIFWLAITFTFLFVVLWRLAGPRIHSVIVARRGQINDDLAVAQKHRGDAGAASAAYQTALAGARARATALADGNRKSVIAEIDKAKAASDAQAAADIAKAEGRINAMRDEAKGHVANAARDAAIDIVAHLTGETVSADDAAAAVRAVTGA